MISSWSWDFGDSGTSSAENPSHDFTSPGTYTVALNVAGPGGSDTETKVDYIVVSEPPPNADYSANPKSGVAPLTVDFTDLSTGTITSWDWDFGDGGSFSTPNPSYEYSNPGIYSVSLTVSGPGGPDTKTEENFITVYEEIIANFTASPTSGAAPLEVSFTDASFGNISSWSWTFGDGGSSSLTNPGHQYTAPGIYSVSLTVSGPAGSDTETKTNFIEVAEPPTENFIMYLPLSNKQ